MQKLVISGIKILPTKNSALVLLNKPKSHMCLPIWIGVQEAEILELYRKKTLIPKPLIYDLFNQILNGLNTPITALTIVKLENNIFQGQLVLANSDSYNCRVSDGLIISSITEIPIFATDKVLKKYAIYLDSNEKNSLLSSGYSAELEIAKFKAFLNNVNPQDFS